MARAVQGLNPGEEETFRVRPDLLFVPTTLLCNGYRVSLARATWPERGVEHAPSSGAEVKETVGLCLMACVG